MKSYYGNLIVDIFELIFAIVSLLLVWISFAKDTVVFFGISTTIYMFPRLLSIVMGIVNNGRDFTRLIFDLISLVTLLLSFMIVCTIMFDYLVPFLSDEWKNISEIIFYVLSAISLCDVFHKVFFGVAQKASLTYRNYKTKSILGGN